jgi:hypothetical protein
MPACGTGNSLSESDSQDSSDEERLGKPAWIMPFLAHCL